MNGTEEIPSGFVVAGGDGAVRLELGEEIFDQVAGLVQVPVTTALNPVLAARRNHDLFARFFQRINQPLLGIVGFVRKEGVGLGIRQQFIGTDEVVGLPGGEVKSRRIAQRIRRGVDLCTQPAAAQSDRLAFFGLPLDGPGTVLVSPNDGGINHAPLVVRVLGKKRKDTRPHPGLAPTRESQVYHAKIPKTLGQVSPRKAGFIPIPHRLHEPSMVSSRHPNVPFPPWQEILDAVPLVVSQCMSMCHPFSFATRFVHHYRGDPVIDDTP